MVAEALAGVVAITVTPFDEDGSVDVPAYERVVRRLDGVHAITVNGNTSEFYTLSTEECRTAVDVVAGAGALTLCGVGHDLASAVELAKYAAARKLDGVMVHQPAHPYLSLDGWIEYHRAIADAVPSLAVVPYVRDPRIGGAQIGALAGACDNVVAVKYAVADPVRFACTARDAGVDRLVWVAGLAELSAPGYFAYGAKGFTSGLANVAPELSLRMFELLAAGEDAGEVWGAVRRFEELRAVDGGANNVAVVKEALAQQGVCRRDVRPPGHVLGEVDRDAVREVLASWA
ncbi:4-hydroxy-tetrahydrodipicolinate synthase [Saccharothrix variisporea]|uniref:4-hydroxy-tetrahydrodipicolinate synthase n=1 Tax=Saccharothrix variisporea TaxID=543527 RepID=A0A495XGL7_9PSEU|nr:4-hydroxy-tetrahydrodipicolinate synthase [Saccharothrix variisporea]